MLFIKLSSNRKFLAVMICINLFLVSKTSAYAQDSSAYENSLDETIRSACHSFDINFIPDAISWLKNDIFNGSPFCNKISESKDDEDINDAIQDQYKLATKNGQPIDYSKKHDWDLDVTIDCQSEYMCLETRLRYQDSKNPVSQEAYQTVSDYCEERYGCIEAFFLDWPKPLPKPQSDNARAALTFESILGSPQPNITPVKNEVIEPAVVTTTQSTNENNAASEGSDLVKESGLLFGDNMPFNEAKSFCDGQGMHLPTLTEARKRLSELRTRDPYLGIWTSDQNSTDTYVNRYRTLRDNGHDEGESASSKQRVVCFS